MLEIELKFQIPESRRAAVRRAVATRPARSVHLRAQYFDTPDRRLAAAGLALRLRLEDGRWTQAAKGRADILPCRLEHEVTLAASEDPPSPDLSRHAGSAAGKALEAALGGATATDLRPSFMTDVQRTRRRFRSGRTIVELALDAGHIRAGDAELPILELEFELVEGPVEGLIRLATRWAERHGLWLDVRSKAERGDQLLRGVAADAPVVARAPRLHTTAHADAALRAIVGSCLEQILPNAAATAAGVGSAEHLHQTRVGLRRLRSALRTFGSWSGAVDPAWPAAMARLFARLGPARDSDTVKALLPRLQAAGAPEIPLEAAGAPDDASAALRAPDVARLMLGLIGFALDRTPGEDAPHGKLARRARSGLVRLHRSLHRDAALFAALDDTERHRLRKRLKRLRYSVEIVAHLFPVKPLQRYLARLRPAQDILGRYNDLQVAQMRFLSLLQNDPRAWFALGWLAANRSQLQREASRALRRLPATPKFLQRH